MRDRGRRKRDAKAVSAFDSPAPRPVSVLEERLAALKNTTASEVREASVYHLGQF